MKTKQMDYRVELNPNSTVEPTTNQHFRSWLSRIWRFLVDASFKEAEPQIWQKRDRAGNFWWHAVDPATGQSTWLNSEDEARIWIEQLHYRQPPAFLPKTDFVEAWRIYRRPLI